jgi:hypothetical protein
VAGQGFERREILRVLSLAAAAGQFGVFERWAFACPEHPETGLVAGPAGTYKPSFFTPDEYATVEILTDLIIPNDGRPGAKDAGVSEFVDFMVGSDPDVQPQFRFGLAWLDAHARYLLKQPFRSLTHQQQAEILTPLAYREKQRTDEKEGRAFFELMREYTVMGFYTSRAGLEDIGFPGLKQMWDHDPTACPHVDDREHTHLKPVVE